MIKPFAHYSQTELSLDIEMYLNRIVVFTFLAICLSQPALAREIKKTVPPGETVILAFGGVFTEPPPSCANEPKRYELRSQPSLGQISTRVIDEPIVNVDKTERAACEGMAAKSTELSYTAGDTPGTDEFKMRTFRGNGKSVNFKVRIEVQED